MFQIMVSNLSQKELGAKIGISQQQIAQYETGKRTPKLENLYKIADALSIDISSLTDYSPVPDDFSTYGFNDFILQYCNELGEFLYHNPNHKELFDLVMDIKPKDIEFVKTLITKLNKAPTD